MVLHRRREQVRFLIEDETQIGEARRGAQRLALAYGLEATHTGQVALAATELATNLWRHAGGGELLIQPVQVPGGEVIELLAIDRGRGMSDVERCLSDGYSTGGTSGTGLGAVRRLAAEFDIYSAAGEGTVVLCRVGPAPAPRFGAVSIPVKGETECGDGWALATDAGSLSLMVVDGLGHGPLAARAAECAQGAFAAAPREAPRALLERTHRALSGTRGAAAAVAHVEDAGRVAYAGIGNICGHLVSAQRSQGMVSHNGTLGLMRPHLQQFDYARADKDLLVMHTDGISGRWNLAPNVTLRSRHPAIIAAVLYRDHARARDDATVVVLN